MKTKNRITGHIFNSAACAGVLMFMAAGAHAQNLFVSSANGSIYEIAPNGTVSTFATGIESSGYMAFNGAGDLFVASGNSIIEITPSGAKSTFASVIEAGALTFNSAGNLFVSGGNIFAITPGGVESQFFLRGNTALAFNSAGDLFLGGGNITEIELGGLQLTFTSGPLTSSLAFNNAGDLFAMDYQNYAIVEITPNGTISTFARATVDEFDYQQLAINNQGILFASNQSAGSVVEFNSSGTASTFASGLGTIEGMAFQPVPEPSVMGLLGIGATLIGLRRKTKGR